MFDQMVNEYGYHRRSVKKNDLDGFIAVCKEFIEWVNAKYPREAVLQKQTQAENSRENQGTFVKIPFLNLFSDFFHRIFKE